ASPDDMSGVLPGYYGMDDNDASSLWLTEKLWHFRVFPELQAALLDGLLDTSLPADYRAGRFTGIAASLAAAAEVLASEDEDASGNFDWDDLYTEEPWLSYFSLDPLIFGGALSEEEREEFEDYGFALAEATPEGIAAYREKLRFAAQILPIFYADMMAEEAALLEKLGTDGYDLDDRYRNDAASWEKDDVFMYDTGAALLALWENRDKPAAKRSALAVLQSDVLDAEQRYMAVRLAVKKPGLPLAEYIQWVQYADDLDGITRCLGTAPTFFGYFISCCDELGDVLRADLRSRKTLLLGPVENAPGIRVRKISSLPPIEAKDPIYFLADMKHALPAFDGAPGYDLSRALPIFEGTALRHLENQPLVLPLDVKRDDALIRWYFAEGAAQGRLMLFSATGTAKDVARHMGGLHLMWWPKSEKDALADGNDDPSMALMHPGNGPFMKGTLPAINGEAAARFLGPVTGLWYCVEELEGDQWYEAKPDPALAAQHPQTVRTVQDKTDRPVFLLSREVTDALSAERSYNAAIRETRRLMREYPDTGADPISLEDAFAFVRDRRGEVYGYGITGQSNQNKATELFWRFRKDEKATGILREILGNDNTPARKRLEEARRAVGLPAEVR
ncbi:hypothetical protein LJC23_01750, partial [Desulfovibrio sp. OttesenSCG-928-I05]|nr:hypothetical protein [Desulfovibrio sp. OttesenSCG-928-I05]